MSTVDAAIIKYITNGGGSSGGGGGGESGGGGGSGGSTSQIENDYGILSIDSTSGGYGTLAFNAKNGGAVFTLNHSKSLGVPFELVARYDSQYPYFGINSPNFQMECSKNGQTGKSLTQITSNLVRFRGDVSVDEGFTFTAPNIYTKSEIDTMFATGGNTDVDTMTVINNFSDNPSSTAPSGGEWFGISFKHKKYAKTGCVLKIYNNRSGEIEEYVLIRKSDEINVNLDEITDSTASNATLISLTSDRVVPAYIGFMESQALQCALAFVVTLNTYDPCSDSNGTGLFAIDHMSHSTLVKIVKNYHTTYDQSV